MRPFTNTILKYFLQFTNDICKKVFDNNVLLVEILNSYYPATKRIAILVVLNK